MEDEEIKQYKFTVLLGSKGDMEDYWDTPEQAAERVIRDKIYIDKLKAEGTLFKPVEYTLHYKANSLVCDKQDIGKESYRFIILDLTK